MIADVATSFDEARCSINRGSAFLLSANLVHVSYFISIFLGIISSVAWSIGAIDFLMKKPSFVNFHEL
jgi:hypothetical protein